MSKVMQVLNCWVVWQSTAHTLDHPQKIIILKEYGIFYQRKIWYLNDVALKKWEFALNLLTFCLGARLLDKKTQGFGI